MSLFICPTHGLHHVPFCCDRPSQWWEGSFADEEIIMDKETSNRVSSLAAKYIDFQPIQLVEICKEAMSPDGNGEVQLCDDIRTLAASCMSQDETPGQDKEKTFDGFFVRLKTERDDLDGRLSKLALFLGKGAPGTTSYRRDMLNEQSKLMSDLLAVLDERLADLGIANRSVGAENPSVASIGEPREVGGHNEDRDGPVPFGA